MSNRKSKRAQGRAINQADQSGRTPLAIERSPRETIGEVIPATPTHDNDRSAVPCSDIRTSCSSVTTSVPCHGREKNSSTNKQVRVEREHLSLSTVLQRAREYFQTSPMFGTNKKEKSGIETFFERYGFFIKIAHFPKHSSADATSDRGAAMVSDLGIFAINDDDNPTSGIIVDAIDNFKVLVTPLPDVVRDENAIKFCLESLENYDVYNALDGTRVTWYYVARLKAWFMATARSYDARAYKWIGPKTYTEAFMECARPYVGADFSVETLNKDATYSFIFRHHDFHPLKSDPQGLWQISGPVVTGIPQYTPIPAADVLSPPDRLRFQAQRAFVDYAKTGVCNYGYIFRRRGEGSPAAVYLESSLHEFVRKQMYDIPSVAIGLTNENRMTYLHLRGYMSFGMNHVHVMMFPSAAEVYTKMDFIIALLTDITVAEMRFNRTAMNAAGAQNGQAIAAREDREIVSRAQSEIGGSLFGSSWNSVRDVITKIGHLVAEDLTRAGIMSAFGDHIHANVRDQYMGIANMPNFMDILLIK